MVDDGSRGCLPHTKPLVDHHGLFMVEWDGYVG